MAAEERRELETARETVAKAHQEQVEALERVSGVSAEDAKGLLLEAVREEAEQEPSDVPRASSLSLDRLREKGLLLFDALATEGASASSYMLTDADTVWSAIRAFFTEQSAKPAV